MRVILFKNWVNFTRCLSTLSRSEKFSASADAGRIKSSSNLKIIRQKRNDLFLSERERQTKLVGKIEKINVHVYDPARSIDCDLKMNKNVSTPFDCALHVNDAFTKFSALALVNDKPWDMHRPLTTDCEINYLFFTDADCFLANQAYWRSCSFILGYILETAFRDEFPVLLHSWPSANYHTGSFVYDAQIGLSGWTPTKDELRILSKVPAKDLQTKQLPFERLEVDISVAEKIFEDNPFKIEQLRFMAQSSKEKNLKVTLYRVGDHIDISRGPMICNTNQLGYYSVAAFHPFESEDFGPLYRVQGVSVPFTQRVNSWSWEIVTIAAKRKNEMPLPNRRRYENQTG